VDGCGLTRLARETIFVDIGLIFGYSGTLFALARMLHRQYLANFLNMCMNLIEVAVEK
jgi:hypothetical protein